MTACKCEAFWSEGQMEGKTCRFNPHPNPALCGIEGRRAPEPEQAQDWYGTGDMWNWQNNDPGDEA